jgi:hypothetical protein
MDDTHAWSETTNNWGGCFVELQIGVAPTQSHTFPLEPESSHHHSEYVHQFIQLSFVRLFVFAFVSLSRWVHAAICEGLDLPALKCLSNWSLGLCPVSVEETCTCCNMCILVLSFLPAAVCYFREKRFNRFLRSNWPFHTSIADRAIAARPCTLIFS